MRLLRDLFHAVEGRDENKFKNLEIATVDGFQGREKEVWIVKHFQRSPCPLEFNWISARMLERMVGSTTLIHS